LGGGAPEAFDIGQSSVSRGNQIKRFVTLWRGEKEFDARDIRDVISRFDQKKMQEITNKIEFLKVLHNEMAAGIRLPRDDAKFIAAYYEVVQELQGASFVFNSLEIPIHRWMKARCEVFFGRAKILADESIVETNADGSIKRVAHGE
jgi:hypothetical protein